MIFSFKFVQHYRLSTSSTNSIQWCDGLFPPLASSMQILLFQNLNRCVDCAHLSHFFSSIIEIDLTGKSA